MRFRYALAVFLFLALFPAVRAQSPGSCTPGRAIESLSVSDVRARLFNDGILFSRGGEDSAYYEVPKDSGLSPIFAAGLWVGGEVGGSIRTAWAAYGEREFWPGPLENGATLPNPSDCAQFDRIYRVTAPEVAAFEAGNAPTPALEDWPVGLGAPTVDLNGVPIQTANRERTIDLEAGERPVIYGSATAFWVMNDVGNDHLNSNTNPLGVEVRVTAFAINAPAEPGLDQSTVYRYEITNRGTSTISDFRAGFWVDADLGNADDDFAGTSPERSLLFAYNADNVDEVAQSGYGTAPPAIGIDLLNGASYGVVFNNDSDPQNGNPSSALDVYNFLRGVWRDGSPWTRGGDGTDPSGGTTAWLYDREPFVSSLYWSERDTESFAGLQPNDPGDRRGVISADAVSLAPGASQTLDVAVLFARGTDHINSAARLFDLSDFVQDRYADGSLFATTSGDLGSTPTAPPTLVAPSNGTEIFAPDLVTLDWTAVKDADGYRVELSMGADLPPDQILRVSAPPLTLDLSVLQEDTREPVYWRVIPTTEAGDGPASAVRSFVYGFTFDAGALLLTNSQPAFVEVIGPGGVDPCGPNAESTYGCDEVDGNAVYVPNGSSTADGNSTGTYALTAIANGPDTGIAPFAPRDYELRFTAGGSIGHHLFDEDSDGAEFFRVPFEVWDIGVVAPGTGNDSSDDVRMIPVLFSDDAGNGTGICDFDLAEVPAGAPENPLGVPLSDRIYAYYPTTTYVDYNNSAAPLVEAAPDGCYDDTDGTLGAFIDLGRGRPLRRVVVADLAGTGDVAALQGAVIRFYTTDPITTPRDSAPVTPPLALSVAPNPSRGSARVSFALSAPGVTRVRVVDVLGREVAVLADGERAAGAHTVALPRRLASGVYVVTVEAGDARASRTVTVVR